MTSWLGTSTYPVLVVLGVVPQVVSPFNQDGLLEDWELVKRMWDYALK